MFSALFIQGLEFDPKWGGMSCTDEVISGDHAEHLSSQQAGALWLCV